MQHLDIAVVSHHVASHGLQIRSTATSFLAGSTSACESEADEVAPSCMHPSLHVLASRAVATLLHGHSQLDDIYSYKSLLQGEAEFGAWASSDMRSCCILRAGLQEFGCYGSSFMVTPEKGTRMEKFCKNPCSLCYIQSNETSGVSLELTVIPPAWRQSDYPNLEEL